MSQTFVTEFSESDPSIQQHDLLARLYREIGLSAVAAALEVIDSSSKSSADGADSSLFPAFLREELAA